MKRDAVKPTLPPTCEIRNRIGKPNLQSSAAGPIRRRGHPVAAQDVCEVKVLF